MTERDQNSYDAVPYPSYPRPHAHPRHLATIATLFGLNPVPIQNCRVLELGCGTGGNLVPIASSQPHAQCVGIDLSQKQIDAASRLSKAAALENLSLVCMSILDFDETFGNFDYIICHGVYSWVPPDVQRKILEICRSQLNENGLAFVSYNTHPGWHQRGAVRQMMNYHVSRFAEDSPSIQIQRARRFLKFLTDSTKPNESSYGLMLLEQLNLLNSLPDGYLFHEHLEEFNEPIWFLDFCHQIEKANLRYLADADFSSMVAGSSLPTDAKQLLGEFAPNLLEREQYLDFLSNRSFRQSLLCHASQRPIYDIRAERVTALYAASPLTRKDATLSLSSPDTEEFCTSDGMTLSTPLPIFKAALTCLRAIWPSFLSFDDLFQQSYRLVTADRKDPTNDEQESHRLSLARSLLTTFASTTRPLVQLAISPPMMASSISATPRASPLARVQASNNEPVVNARHEIVGLTPLDRRMLSMLDGTSTLDDIAELVRLMVLEGEITISGDASVEQSVEPTSEILREVVSDRLRFFLSVGLLK